MDRRARLINTGKRDPRGQAILMAPVPLKAKDYEESIQWGHLGDPKAALAKQEMARAMKLYERFRAWLQPVKFHSGKVVWAVCFPPGSPHKSGPQIPKAYEALMQNYVLNKGFPHHNPLSRGDGREILNFERHNEASIQEADKLAAEAQQ